MLRHTIVSLASADPSTLYELMKPLGLWRIRSRRLPLMADAWLRSRPRDYNDVLNFPGCGNYAADSWAIFVEGRTDVEPDDGKLTWYMERLNGRKERPDAHPV